MDTGDLGMYMAIVTFFARRFWDICSAHTEFMAVTISQLHPNYAEQGRMRYCDSHFVILAEFINCRSTCLRLPQKINIIIIIVHGIIPRILRKRHPSSLQMQQAQYEAKRAFFLLELSPEVVRVEVT
jgi:hypothetical protein